MKHPFLSFAKATMLLLALHSCSDNPDNDNLTEEEAYTPLSHIDITAEDFKSDADSRTSLGITASGAEFSWSKNDTVGIFPNTGKQAYFPISTGIGTNKASFTSGSWTLEQSPQYVAYYPFYNNSYLDKKNISLDYTGQKQTGNSQTGHLGMYDFMAAPASYPTDGYVCLKLNHLNSLVEFKLTVPAIATFTSLTMSSDEAIFTEKAKLNLTGASYTYTPTNLTKELSMTLDEIASTTENQVLTFYMMVGPVDMTGHIVNVTLCTNDDELYKGTLTPKRMLAGHVYSFSSTLESPDNTDEEDKDSLTHIDIIAKDFESDDTSSRAIFNITGNGVEFSWSQNDTVGIFPSTGNQACFPISAGAGTKKASFTEGGWTLNPSDFYTAYFPFIDDTYLDKENISLDYTGQKQTGDSQTGHLSWYDFMATPVSYPTDGYVSFMLDHLGCLVEFKLTVPVTATFSSLTLSAEEAIFTEKAKLNLVGESYSYTPMDMTQRLTMTLDEIGSETENQVLTFYMMVAPADMTGHTVNVTLRTNDNELYKGTLTSKKMIAGHAYRFSSTLEGTSIESDIKAPDFGDKDNEI